MTRLVDDLLDVSRITEHKLAIRREPMRVGAWVEHALEAVGTSLGHRRFRVALDPAAAQSWVSGDEVRLTQVLTNLVGNAIKFTPDHGRIDVSGRRVGDSVELEVADDGIGMDPDNLHRVFDLFYQAPQAEHRSRAGLGLGLSIVRSLVDMHGGAVEAHSAGPGRGSRFVVRLPCVPAPVDAPALHAAHGVAASSGKVLVVDDNRDAADTASALLEAFGYSVRVVYGAQDALTALDEHAAEVAVLDIGMPGMDGYQLAAAILARPGCAGIRLVALTGYGSETDVGRAHAGGFDLHLTKPVDPDHLLAVVRRMMDRRSSKRGSTLPAA